MRKSEIKVGLPKVVAWQRYLGKVWHEDWEDMLRIGF